MNLFAWAMNTGWMLGCQRELSAFHRATRAVASTQERLLLRIVERNRATDFGRQYKLERVRSVQDFRSLVPVSSYEELLPFIDRIARGENNVLTHDRVERLVPTSGTMRAEKWIPYTASLRRQFQRGIAAWIGDLYRQRPQLRRGRAYWSISPSLGPTRTTSGGLPIGFEDDTAYLRPWLRWVQQHLLAVTGEAARLTDLTNVRYLTLLRLLAASDLSLISVWNPTFLTLLLEPLRTWGDRLCDDLRGGTVSLPHAAQEPIPALSIPMRPQIRRARDVQRWLLEIDDDAALLRQLWPQLALLSCWTDAAARQFVPSLQRLFPHVEIQGKGLLATEGFISFPLCDAPGSALAVRSHFLEFSEGDSDRMYLAHELEQGGRYCVLLTTGGGLYRYPLQDEIEVVGNIGQCPLIAFLGKADRTSDLVGEKLAEQQVQHALSQVWREQCLSPSFALLAPVLAAPPRYRLFVQGIPSDAVAGVACALETALRANPYYRHAVEFGQLAPVEVAQLAPDAESGPAIYERHCLARGQKAGDIKPTVLDRSTNWHAAFFHALQDGATDHVRSAHPW